MFTTTSAMLQVMHKSHSSATLVSACPTNMRCEKRKFHGHVQKYNAACYAWNSISAQGHILASHSDDCIGYDNSLASFILGIQYLVRCNIVILCNPESSAYLVMQLFEQSCCECQGHIADYVKQCYC